MARSLESRIDRLEQRRQQVDLAPQFVGRLLVREGANAADTEQRIEAARSAAGFAPGAPVIVRVLVAAKAA